MLEDFGVGDEVTPVDFEDGTKAMLVITFNEPEMTAVGDLGVRAILECCEYDGPVESDF